MNSSAAAHPAGSDATLSMEEATRIAMRLLPLCVAGTLLPFLLIWGWPALREGLAALLSLWTLVGFAAAVVAHEGLHALGFLLAGRAPISALHFGIDRETGSPYAGCRVPVSSRAYRVAVILPALLLGVLPAGYALLYGIGWLAVWSALMIVVSMGDFMVLWAVRSVAPATRVLDHPQRVGCLVLDG